MKQGWHKIPNDYRWGYYRDGVRIKWQRTNPMTTTTIHRPLFAQGLNTAADHILDLMGDEPCKITIRPPHGESNHLVITTQPSPDGMEYILEAENGSIIPKYPEQEEEEPEPGDFIGASAVILPPAGEPINNEEALREFERQLIFKNAWIKAKNRSIQRLRKGNKMLDNLMSTHPRSRNYPEWLEFFIANQKRIQQLQEETRTLKQEIKAIHANPTYQKNIQEQKAWRSLSQGQQKLNKLGIQVSIHRAPTEQPTS